MDVVEVEPENACPIAPVVDVLFSRWTTPILWTLNTFGRQRFSELERRISTISPKVLTQRLRQLERDGLVVRTYHAEVPPRVEYEISNSAMVWRTCSRTSHSGAWTTSQRSKPPVVASIRRNRQSRHSLRSRNARWPARFAIYSAGTVTKPSPATVASAH